MLITGAGLSTAAGIPDYRGTNGKYRTIKKRGYMEVGKLRLPEATTAIPTFSHMAIAKLVQAGFVSFLSNFIENRECH